MLNVNAVKIIADAIGMAGVLFGKEISSEQQLAYAKLLSKHGAPDAIAAAVERACEVCRFMPTVADILEHLGVGPKALEDRALTEANRIITAVRNCGFYQKPSFEDPVTQALVDRGAFTWRHICTSMTEANETWYRKEIAAAYLAYERNEDRFRLTDNRDSRRLKLLAGGIGEGSK